MREGKSYNNSCPIKLKDLRYLQMNYIGFDNKTHLGEMIVHKSLAKEVGTIF